MVIDFHTHIFPDKIAAKTIESLEAIARINAASDGTLNGLLDSMHKSGVDQSVIMPVCTKAEQFDSINTFAKKVNDTYEGKLISFGGIHPDCENPKEKLKYIKSLGIPGIKIHPDYQKVMIDDVRFMRIIDYASELGLVILTHAGIDIGLPEPVHCPPDKMRKVLDTLKPDKMVLAHLGGWKQWEEVYEYLAGKNVYLDTSFTVGVSVNHTKDMTLLSEDKQKENSISQNGAKYTEYIEQDLFLKILRKHDTDKILFATDSPWSNSIVGMEYIRNLPISEKGKKQILSENAIRLLDM